MSVDPLCTDDDILKYIVQSVGIQCLPIHGRDASLASLEILVIYYLFNVEQQFYRFTLMKLYHRFISPIIRYIHVSGDVIDEGLNIITKMIVSLFFFTFFYPEKIIRAW